ncbi:MAG TPA: DUF2795 domain-containing protein [Chloroflexota bacterium]|jgi:hypothetical protein|nr:DUF2795 domain-containing protein [Chloroflexota bacterium]
MPHHEPLHAPVEEVLTYLHGVHFPCTKQDLLDTARRHHAPANVLRALEIMYPEEFSDLDDVRRNLTSSEARAEQRERRA